MGSCCNMLEVAYLAMFGFVSVSAVNYSLVDEGSPMGYLPTCPDIWKPVVIEPESLKKLFIVVMDPTRYWTSTWTKYDYFRVKELVKHPAIDFKNKKTFLYVGGYTDFTWPMIGKTLGQLYGRLGYNVLMLDALHFTARFFPLAARYIRQSGKHVAEMLAELVTLGLDPKRLELVGISLGGQHMSFIAKNFRQITGKNISMLVALDPEGPCHRHLGPDQRIDPSDADFVLDIATNIDGFGMATPVGHVTFYVNGGEYQPHEIWWLPCNVICSHVRAMSLWFSALINPHKFIGMQCDSIQQAREGNCYERKPFVTNTMDLFVDKSKPGIYYLATSNRYPYALGKKGLKRKHEMIVKQLGSLNVDDVLHVR